MGNIAIGRPVIIGGMVMDLRGRPAHSLQLYTSNPGFLQQMPGGVGRNIAENMCRLGHDPLLISAVGADLTGDTLLRHSQTIGLSTEGVLQLTGERTAVYLAILNEIGDLHTAIADMSIFEHLTPERVLAFADLLATAPLVIMDTNLPKETISAVCHFCVERQIPLFVEPVSVEKSRKLEGLLSMVTYISPNQDELAALAGQPINSAEEAEQAMNALLDQGAQNILLTVGKDGALLANSTGITHYPAFPAVVCDVTGAGDSFVAGMVAGLLWGKPIQQALLYGLATAKLTVETAETVAPQLQRVLLDTLIMEV